MMGSDSLIDLSLYMVCIQLISSNQSFAVILGITLMSFLGILNFLLTIIPVFGQNKSFATLSLCCFGSKVNLTDQNMFFPLIYNLFDNKFSLLFSMKSFVIMSRCCIRSLFAHKRMLCNSFLCATRVSIAETWAQFKITLYTLYLLCLRSELGKYIIRTWMTYKSVKL